MINLTLNNAQGFVRKISNNLLSCGDEKVVAFTIPIDGISLNPAQLDALLGRFTHRSWYATKPDGAVHPMPWWEGREKRDFHLGIEFECAEVTFTLPGGKELTFEAQGDREDEDDPYTPGARLTHLVLTPQPGGQTLLAIHITVRPGVGKENLLLQEQQWHHVGITLGEVREGKRKALQAQLALGEGPQTIPDPAPENPKARGLPSALEVRAEMERRGTH